MGRFAGRAARDELELTLRLTVGAEPIAGSVGWPEGPRRSFHGWMELATLLDEGRSPRAASTPTNAQSDQVEAVKCPESGQG